MNRVEVLVMLCLLFTVGGCRPSADAPRPEAAPRSIDSKAGSPAASEACAGGPGGRGVGEEAPVLRVAVAPVISPEESLILYKDLVEHLAGELGMRGVLLQRTSYSETNTLIRQRQCDVAFVCTYAYVRGKEDFGMNLLATPVVDGQSRYHSFFIVPADSEATSILDLKGKRFASSDPLSNTGWLYPSTVLHGEGLDHQEFFSEVVYTGGHDRSVRAVADGIVDGAAVDNLVFEQVVEEDPEVGVKTRVIHRSPAFGMPPVVVHPRLPEATQRRISEVLLSMHESPEGARVLEPLRIDRFLEPDPEAYNAVKRMMRLLETSP